MKGVGVHGTRQARSEPLCSCGLGPVPLPAVTLPVPAQSTRHRGLAEVSYTMQSGGEGAGAATCTVRGRLQCERQTCGPHPTPGAGPVALGWDGVHGLALPGAELGVQGAQGRGRCQARPSRPRGSGRPGAARRASRLLGPSPSCSS